MIIKPTFEVISRCPKPKLHNTYSTEHRTTHYTVLFMSNTYSIPHPLPLRVYTPLIEADSRGRKNQQIFNYWISTQVTRKQPPFFLSRRGGSLTWIVITIYITLLTLYHLWGQVADDGRGLRNSGLALNKLFLVPIFNVYPITFKSMNFSQRDHTFLFVLRARDLSWVFCL